MPERSVRAPAGGERPRSTTAIFWLLKILTRLRVREEAVKGPTPSEKLLAEILEELKKKP